MLHPVTIFSNETKKNFVFSRINLVFGYAQSGKTTLLSLFASIFAGKDRHYLVNGTQSMPNDYNVVFLSSNEGISSHLKLSAKSLLRKAMVENKYSPNFVASCEQIKSGISMARSEMQAYLQSLIPESKLAISQEENPLDLIVDNMTVSLDEDSSSIEKERLFSLVDSLSKSSSSPTIVIIDDFANDFDEEMILQFFERINQTNAYFILSSKKVIPQSCIKKDVSLFAVRNFELIPMPSLEDLVFDSVVGHPDYVSFEEYITGSGYLSSTGIPELFLQRIQDDEKTNFLRILTSKNPVISASASKNAVTILPKTKEEESFYKKVFSLLGIK